MKFLIQLSLVAVILGLMAQPSASLFGSGLLGSNVKARINIGLNGAAKESNKADMESNIKDGADHSFVLDPNIKSSFDMESIIALESQLNHAELENAHLESNIDADINKDQKIFIQNWNKTNELGSNEENIEPKHDHELGSGFYRVVSNAGSVNAELGNGVLNVKIPDQDVFKGDLRVNIGAQNEDDLDASDESRNNATLKGEHNVKVQNQEAL